nr:MAG TPA: hypothetical protein [Caudoviricetes sp.]DAX47319.1 MAG TPA: hypothetical protein [Caudoviricetes sp.]
MLILDAYYSWVFLLNEITLPSRYTRSCCHQHAWLGITSLI